MRNLVDSSAKATVQIRRILVLKRKHSSVSICLNIKEVTATLGTILNSTHLYLVQRFTGGLQGIFYVLRSYRTMRPRRAFFLVSESCFLGIWQNCFREGSTNLKATLYTGGTQTNKQTKSLYHTFSEIQNHDPTASACRFYTYLNHVVTVISRVQRRVK
jgi:hypothetical protein